MFEIKMLPARQGDAFWIRWGEEKDPYQLIIDMGTEEIGKKMRERILHLPISQRNFELLVITHVDRDHIGGVLSCLVDSDPIENLKFKDIWFNGWTHLNGGSVEAKIPDGNTTMLEGFGPVQGERLSKWLHQQPWNKCFDGGPVVCKSDMELEVVTLQGGLKLTVLGPTKERLTQLIDTWKDDVAEALKKGSLIDVSPGLEAFGSKIPPKLEDRIDLELLANSNSGKDISKANGSSIALLLEYQDYRVVLSGDAWDSDLVAAFRKLSPDVPYSVNAFKLPHHASKNNVTRKLIESVVCKHWLISTDGSQFCHPDAVAIARILLYSNNQSLLSFNVRSDFNNWWDNSNWKGKFGYCTQYGDKDDGITLSFN